jgi:UDP-N-acetylmuramoyl-L-alanyl-D-glutamate--2,6-diaminopimelate ligase
MTRQSGAMRLGAMVGSELFVPPEWDREFCHLVTDTRDVQSGDLFIARSGRQADGHIYVANAIAAGAVAVLEEGPTGFRCEAGGVPVFVFPDLSRYLTTWLQRRYAMAMQMPLLAVTGTNGKSSTVQYVAQLVTTLGQRCGVIGTTGNGVWPELAPTRNTTPDLATILRCLEIMQQQGATIAAMEVSSHGIDQGRIAGLSFVGAAITNVTQDHLDYHGDMDAYLATKARLFHEYSLQQALFNIDDERVAGLLTGEPLAAPVLTLSTQAMAGGDLEQEADIRIRVVALEPRCMRADLATPWGQAELRVPLIGEFNLTNAVMAISLLAMAGFDFDALVAAAASLRPVAGRMELYIKEQAPTVVVDFAHTPDALTTILKALQPWNCPLTLVYGCGGERDRSKRPLMTAAALAGAHQVWLTDDNPRHEDPDQIWSDALAVDGSERIHCEHDREAAISRALDASPVNGLVIVAGKGHEDYQEIAGVKHSYSDAAVLLEMGYQRAGSEYAV